MAPSSISTPVLQSLSTQYAKQLKQRICGTLSHIINNNSKTTYFRDAPLLAQYRAELELDSIPKQGTPEVDLSTFTRTVPLSTYEDYRPYISRFTENPCLQSSVDSLLAPGLPIFVAASSGTSGSSAKYYPKYARPVENTDRALFASMMAGTPETDGPTRCIVFGLRYTHLLDVFDGQKVVRKIPFGFGTAGTFCGHNGWEIENDNEFIKMRLSGQVTPVAVAFIKPYYTFLFLHALFAMGERSLTTFNTIFITAFSDLVRLIETHWKDLVRAIETGQVPDLEGLDELRPHIQAHLRPRPGRAEELRRISVNVGAVGWLKQIWPNLTLVAGNTTGWFSATTPRVRDHVGPSVSMQSVAYASSEAWIGAVYNPKSGENLYKAQTTDDVLEYLDVDKPESAEYITQAWDLEVGKKYEVILTTRDGFWRYRLGDVLEIVGFAPEDRSPLIRFMERRSAVMRVSGEFVSEAELHRAVGSIEDITGRVVEFSVVLEGEPGSRAHDAPRRLQEYLFSTNSTFAQFHLDSKVGEPSVRVLAPGTFGGYRLWRIGVSGSGSGQTKVPTVIYNPEAKDWLIGRVVWELGDDSQKVA
ncbi:GH3 auxin-responsive promoter [Infundibulicybe gibba]|nr:GH3 auxin-responsive promoter [Infundibulicybe gibba]